MDTHIRVRLRQRKFMSSRRDFVSNPEWWSQELSVEHIKNEKKKKNAKNNCIIDDTKSIALHHEGLLQVRIRKHYTKWKATMEGDEKKTNWWQFRQKNEWMKETERVSERETLKSFDKQPWIQVADQNKRKRWWKIASGRNLCLSLF